MKSIITSLGSVVLLGLFGSVANAAAVCTGCERDDAAAGTYLGAHDPLATDVSTFNHTDISSLVGPNAAFTDYWVWDVTSADDGSVSADYTAFTAIVGMTASVYADAGSVCAGGAGSGCAAVVLGALLKAPGDDIDVQANRFEFIFNGIGAGRYILEIKGTTRNPGQSSAYSAQAAFVPQLQIPEPTTLAVLGLGLLGAGLFGRRRA